MLGRYRLLVCLTFFTFVVFWATSSAISWLLGGRSRWGSDQVDVYEFLKTPGSVNIHDPHHQQVRFGCAPDQSNSHKEDWDPSLVLKGKPTKHFRDNLHEDLYYITAMSNAGFTNQFMSIVNMIYLGLITDRIPILPPFAPDHHISYDAGAVPFGRVFNVTRLSQALHKPIVEWHQVKDLPDETAVGDTNPGDREPLGCWSTRHGNEPKPLRVNSFTNNLLLDIAYTRAPTAARNNPSDGDDVFLVFQKLAPFIFAKNPRPPLDGFYPLMERSPLGHELGPDEQLTCFDFLYYITSSEVYEWRFSWSPVWRFVGRHIYFTDHVMDMAREYLLKSFGQEKTIPSFIAVHARHGDFARMCPDSPNDCLISLKTFQKNVADVKEQIRLIHKKVVNHVLIMSDETDPEFWKQVRELGWKYFDHEAWETVPKYGEWYAPIIDIAAQSLASGFVGTEDSTFSLVSARRVEDWNNGPVAWASVAQNT
ncbi:hypothetical protein CVT24_004572 [Panaeolus cyanescens]|uniref:GDP-fucose protein O-fucosyltransferase n=1 Tax=Panaeolus cyanescens TaxID=181874 RepID=A0A409VEK8_9AGAR|nr:hypothetical protein CVT24_004572 [Panaeolus cyanescens]